MTLLESLISSLRTMHVANINLANEAADIIERQQREIESLLEANSNFQKLMSNSQYGTMGELKAAAIREMASKKYREDSVAFELAESYAKTLMNNPYQSDKD